MKRGQANGLLLVAALIWGTAFVAQQTGMRDVGPLAFTGSRFLFGALVVLPLALWEMRRLLRRGVHFDGADLGVACLLGVVLFLGAALQQVGIKGTTVSNAGFLTALYVPMVPLGSALLLRERMHWSVWPASAGCLAGTWMLGGGALAALSDGDLWVIASAFFWAGHVMAVGRVAARKGAPITVAFLQFVVCGVLGMAAGVLSEPLTTADLARAMPSIAYAGVLSVGLGFTLQVVAQRHTLAADAAILLSCETLFAALAARLVLGETMSALQVTGGSLIFGSVLAVQLLPLVRARRPAAAGA